MFFRESVLDKYRANPGHYTLKDDHLYAAGSWDIPMAHTGDGTVQVWLGDLGRIPVSAQRHWQAHAEAGGGSVPEWRIRRDLFAEFTDSDPVGVIGALRVAMADADQAALKRCGVPLFDTVGHLDQQRAGALHVPTNASLSAFQEQLTRLAVVTVEHLSTPFLDAVDAPQADGSLARLAEWLASATGRTVTDARDVLGGLYAVQALRSSMAAHRAGERARDALARAGVALDDLPAGFARLVAGGTAAISAVAGALSEAAGPRVD